MSVTFHLVKPTSLACILEVSIISTHAANIKYLSLITFPFVKLSLGYIPMWFNTVTE